MAESAMNHTPCENITGDVDPAAKETQRIVAIIIPVIFAVIVFLGFVGNLLVIIVVISNKQMRNTTNVLIVNLALADLLFIIFCVPFTAVRYSVTVWPFGDMWCKVINFVMYSTAWGSVYTLVFMSFDRYLAVVHAISSMRIRTTRNAMICISVLWVVILAVNVPTWLLHGADHYEYLNGDVCEDRTICIFYQKEHAKAFYTCFLIFGYILPLSLVCVLYGFMLHRLLFNTPPGGSQSAESLRSKKRVTRLVIIVISIFAICWLPIHIVLMYSILWPQGLANIPGFVLTMASNVLAFTNSCVNPILYAFLSENFRRGFKKILCCGRFNTSRMDIERTCIHRPIEKEKENTSNENGKTCTTTLLPEKECENGQGQVTVL